MAAGDVWRKLRGTIRTIFQIGIGGPNLKNSSGVLEVRNAADSAYADQRLRKVILSDGDEDLTLEVPELDAPWTLRLPPNDGSPGMALITDGGGITTWEAIAGGTDKTITDTTSLVFGSASPVTMFTLPANAVVHKVKAIVDTAFNGTAPTASVGVSGTASKYMASTELDLKTVGVYDVDPGLVAEGSTNALIITYVADSSSAGAARFIVEYSIPS
jgi:hypothetical protein